MHNKTIEKIVNKIEELKNLAIVYALISIVVYLTLPSCISMPIILIPYLFALTKVYEETFRTKDVKDIFFAILITIIAFIPFINIIIGFLLIKELGAVILTDLLKCIDKIMYKRELKRKAVIYDLDVSKGGVTFKQVDNKDKDLL